MVHRHPQSTPHGTGPHNHVPRVKMGAKRIWQNQSKLGHVGAGSTPPCRFLIAPNCIQKHTTTTLAFVVSCGWGCLFVGPPFWFWRGRWGCPFSSILGKCHGVGMWQMWQIAKPVLPHELPPLIHTKNGHTLCIGGFYPYVANVAKKQPIEHKFLIYQMMAGGGCDTRML